MSEADFCGMDAGEYYATKGFLDRERFYRKQEMEEQMKNRVTVRHGMLSDLKTYLKQSGWKLEERGVGYSIDERDVKVYNGWRRNRRKRGIDPDWPTPEERSRYFEGRDGV